ncbi:MAG: YkgJ family cysteine cluster protein [Pseudomonadota bacterium]
MWSGEEFIPRIEALYRAMEVAYDRTATEVGFSCRGCDGTACCTVDLPLRTHAEKLVLKRGFAALDQARQRTIIQRSMSVVGLKAESPRGEAYRGAVCVLNEGGACSLYAHRPMICRLAGVPHNITRPDGKHIYGDGCARFMMDLAPRYPNVRLDRTAFYQELAAVELEMVREDHSRAALETIAEVLVGA